MNAEQDYPVPMQFIAGEWRDGGAGIALQVRNPATGEIIANVPRADGRDLDDALASADGAFDPWRRMPAIDRGAILRKAAQLLRERTPALARLMTLEQGKPLAESSLELK